MYHYAYSTEKKTTKKTLLSFSMQDLRKVLNNLKSLLAKKLSIFCNARNVKCGLPEDWLYRNRLV